MPSMSTIESLFCRSTPWEAATGRWVLPWALQGVLPRGRVLEIGGGGGAMATQILTTSPGDVEVTVTDFDPVMVATSGARLLDDAAHVALRERLLPMATVLTPNIPEAEWLLGRRIDDAASASAALRAMLKVCSPTWLTHPQMTSSTIDPSIPARSARIFSDLCSPS